MTASQCLQHTSQICTTALLSLQFLFAQYQTHHKNSTEVLIPPLMWSMRLYIAENHLLNLLNHIYQLKTLRLMQKLLSLWFLKLYCAQRFCPTLQSKIWKEQAQNWADCLTTCNCQSSRWHKLRLPGYFWCSPFSQPHRALPASTLHVSPGHMHPRSHAHAWKRQDASSISSWYSMAGSLQKRRAMSELQRQHMKQAYLPGSQEPRAGSWSLREMGPHSCRSTRQLLLSLPGPPRWLCKHSQSGR